MKPLDFKQNLALQRRGIDPDTLADDLIRKIVGDLVAADDRATPPAPARRVRVNKRDDTPPAATSEEQPTLRKQIWDTLEHFGKIKLEKGEAKTLEQAIELVVDEHPTLYSGYNEGMRLGEPAEFAKASAPVEPTALEKAVSDAWAPIEKAARALVDTGQAKTIEQAVDRVLDEQPALYVNYEAAERDL